MTQFPISFEFIQTNGITLHTALAGPEDGLPVVLLHGFPEFWRGWINQIEPLAKAEYRVIVPDQRGYNLSDKPMGKSSYTTDILAKDIVGLLDVLGYDKAFIVGHDWGAQVAWYLAGRHSERVKKLVILNVPHPKVIMKTLQSNFSQLRKSWYMFAFQIPWLPDWLLSRNNAALATRMMRGSSNPGTFTEEDLDHYRTAWTKPGAMTAMINWYRAALQIRSIPGISRIRVPTLMLWGKKDVALGYEMAQPSIDLCDDGELVFFENASHWLQHDEIEKVTEHLLSFLR